ncbi:MAG: type 4a pilus biogenesis protein PilO [Candidatus Omnitrophica bacterium]|nr:type 4a pilus biogenesis protein PilO [Candidatus Omnitrophota bacterium]
MFLDKLSVKERIGLSAAFVFLAVAFLDRLLISPIRARFSALNQQIRIGEKQLGSDMRNLNQKDFISEEYAKYFPYIQRSGSDEEEVAKILGEIESLARKSSVYLVDMKPRKPREIGFYKEYTVEIEAQGPMEPLMSFVYQLNTSSLLLRIETLRITQTKSGSKTLTASMLITKALVL